MKIKIDLESDALYFRISHAPIVESEEVGSGLIVDYDTSGRLVGIEILNLMEKFKLEDLTDLKFDMPISLKAAEV